MNKNKIIAAVVAVLAALIVIYVAAAPYITVHQIKSAAKAHDSVALSQHIDFDSVRLSLKEQLNAKFARELGQDPDMHNNPFALLGMALAGVVVDKAVDAYISPSGVTQLMEGRKPQAEHEPEQAEGSAPHSTERKPLADASMGYESLNRFVVKAPDDEGRETQFWLTRRGLSWKLTQIVLPMD